MFWCVLQPALNNFVKMFFSVIFPQRHWLNQGILKGEVSLYRWPPVWLVWNQLYETDNFCFYLQNSLIQTSQTGGQQYSDTSPFSVPWPKPWRVFSMKNCLIFPKHFAKCRDHFKKPFHCLKVLKIWNKEMCFYI